MAATGQSRVIQNEADLLALAKSSGSTELLVEVEFEGLYLSESRTTLTPHLAESIMVFFGRPELRNEVLAWNVTSSIYLREFGGRDIGLRIYDTPLDEDVPLHPTGPRAHLSTATALMTAAESFNGTDVPLVMKIDGALHSRSLVYPSVRWLKQLLTDSEKPEQGVCANIFPVGYR